MYYYKPADRLTPDDRIGAELIRTPLPKEKKEGSFDHPLLGDGDFSTPHQIIGTLFLLAALIFAIYLGV